MKFILPCETYYRLSQILSYFQPDIDETIHKQLNCIRLENVNGITIAIATNQKVAAIEKVGLTDQPNGVAHLVVNEQLINQCKQEKLYNSSLEIIVVPEIAVATLKTMMGYQYSGNACIYPVDTPLDGWRGWATAEKGKKNKNSMYWDMNYMMALNSSSPSGKIIFPEIIDSSIPTILRDVENPNWVGLFLGRLPTEMVPATLPEWWK